jgi:hypothetical protein
MIYHFEEQSVTINDITYLADGCVEYDWCLIHDEPLLEDLFVKIAVDEEGELVNMNLIVRIEEAIRSEFYKSENALYDEVEEHWSEMQ